MCIGMQDPVNREGRLLLHAALMQRTISFKHGKGLWHSSPVVCTQCSPGATIDIDVHLFDDRWPPCIDSFQDVILWDGKLQRWAIWRLKHFIADLCYTPNAICGRLCISWYLWHEFYTKTVILENVRSALINTREAEIQFPDWVMVILYELEWNLTQPLQSCVDPLISRLSCLWSQGQPCSSAQVSWDPASRAIDFFDVARHYDPDWLMSHCCSESSPVGIISLWYQSSNMEVLLAIIAAFLAQDMWCLSLADPPPDFKVLFAAGSSINGHSASFGLSQRPASSIDWNQPKT